MRTIQESEDPETTYNDVVHFVVLEFSGQININLDPVLRVLFFDGVQKRVEPLGASKVADDPSKVDFGEASRLGIVEVVHSVPNRLEDAANPLVNVAPLVDKGSKRLTKQTE